MVAQIIENGIMGLSLAERVWTAMDMKESVKTEMYTI